MKVEKNIMLLSLVLILTNTSFAATATPDNKTALQHQTAESRYARLDIKGKVIVDKSSSRCVADHETRLVWELKTDDGGIHDKDNDYRWGGSGAEARGKGFFDDWNSLLDATNKEKLCGFDDWRVPNIDELKTLVVMGADEPRVPFIDGEYFPLTLASPYWSSSAYANYPEHGQTVHFGNGTAYYYNGYRGNRLPLRLVRGGAIAHEENN